MTPRARLSERDLDRLASSPGDAPVVDEVWRAALAIAGRDIRRIAIVSPTEVVVINQPGEVPAWLSDEPAPRRSRKGSKR